MIEIRDVYKSFRNINAVSGINTIIREGQIFGLVGSNGAGKSTLLRMMSGILKCDKGEILVDGEDIYENEKKKGEICFLSDEAYFLPNATVRKMRDFYAMVYPTFKADQFDALTKKFHMDLNAEIRAFSKGMKKQLSVLLGISANTKYLLCDETFDGLDPVMRQAVKSLFALEILNRDFTPVIASHNLRELEDICDSVGLLHRGGILFTKDLEDMKLHIHKVQCVIPDGEGREDLFRELNILKYEKRGSMLTFVARGERREIMEKVEAARPIFAETIPLSLEEIFISEMEVTGYDIRNFIS